jgi:hypothetical protein
MHCQLKEIQFDWILTGDTGVDSSQLELLTKLNAKVSASAAIVTGLL